MRYKNVAGVNVMVFGSVEEARKFVCKRSQMAIFFAEETEVYVSVELDAFKLEVAGYPEIPVKRDYDFVGANEL